MRTGSRWGASVGALAMALTMGAAFAASVPNGARGLSHAPAGLVAAMVQSAEREAARDPAYRIGADGCAGQPAAAHGTALQACFNPSGPAFLSGGGTRVSLQLVAWGRTGHLSPISLRRVAPQANHIVYRGSGLTEWWRGLPLGWEQGFTLNPPPAGTGRIVLELEASQAPMLVQGNLAWGHLHYGKLIVTDARGWRLPATLQVRGRMIELAINTHAARFPVKVDPLVWVSWPDLTAVDGAAGDGFGVSVALSADGATALVGAPIKVINGKAEQGAAYVFTLTNGTWGEAAELTAADGASNDYFGSSVALSADGATALVGAYNTTIGNVAFNQGAVYVFTLTNGTWSQTAELTAADAASLDYFGTSVALSAGGSTALVGAPQNSIGSSIYQGAAYVFALANGRWSQTQELTAADGASNDYFGSSVALSADGATALVGAQAKTIRNNDGQGAAYMFTLANRSWSQTQELTAADGVAFDGFGHSVSLSADGATALVGAQAKTIGNNVGQGAAYVFTLANGSWSQTQELTAADGATTDYFGWFVALSTDGAMALVGASNKTIDGNSSQGAAYVFTLANGSWSQTSELIAGDGAFADYFGTSVALSADGATAFVGAYGKTVGNNGSQGAAYVFTPANLSAVLSSPASVQANQSFGSQYIVTNNGSIASPPLTVSLPLPSAGAQFVAVSSSQGSCSYSSSTRLATCTLGSLPGSGGEGSATLNLKATGSVGSTIAQSASLVGAAPNLMATANTVISSPPPPLPPPSSKSGGGAFSWLSLALLVPLVAWKKGGASGWRRPRSQRLPTTASAITCWQNARIDHFLARFS